jgi:hypothetical protein
VNAELGGQIDQSGFGCPDLPNSRLCKFGSVLILPARSSAIFDAVEHVGLLRSPSQVLRVDAAARAAAARMKSERLIVARVTVSG